MKTILLTVLLVFGISSALADRYPVVQVSCLNGTLKFNAAVTKIRDNGDMESVDQDGIKFLISREYCLVKDLGVAIVTNN